MHKYIFFRNDDVRNSLDDELIKLIHLFIENNIPISLAIEPANISEEVSKWLLEKKDKYPKLIEIIQHGYDHSLNFTINKFGKTYKGEFGFSQSYEEQAEKIYEGRKIMNSKFGDKWFAAFCFPFGGRNIDSIKILARQGYKVINGSKHYSLLASGFYSIGRLFKREYIFSKRVSWHLKHRFKSQLLQIDTSISTIDIFYDEISNCRFYSFNELKRLTIKYLKRNQVIGIVLHHRYHNEASNKILKKYILWLKSLPNLCFTSQEEIYKRF